MCISNTASVATDDVGISLAIRMATLAIADVNSSIENGLINTLSAPAFKNVFTSDSSALPIITMGKIQEDKDEFREDEVYQSMFDMRARRRLPVNPKIGVLIFIARMARVAVGPSITGITKSIKITS